MFKFIFLSLLLFSQVAFSDLRKAFIDYEAGLRCLYLIESESDQNKRIKLQTLGKKLIQNSSAEFMALRKKGSTVPIAFLEASGLYQQDEIYWENRELLAIDEAFSKEKRDARLLDNNIASIPRIPDELINESHEIYKTSQLSARIKACKENSQKLTIIAELFEHYQTSKSFNLRAAFHLQSELQQFDTNQDLKNFPKAFIHFTKLIDPDDSRKLDDSIKDHIEQKKHSKKLDAFLDPEMQWLLSAGHLINQFARSTSIPVSLTREITVRKVAFKNDEDERFIKLHYALDSDSDQNISEAYLEFNSANTMQYIMTSFQHGGGIYKPLKNDSEFFGQNANLKIATSLLVQNEPSGNYFAYLGGRAFNCPECKALFTMQCQPFCSAFDTKDIVDQTTLYTKPYQKYLLAEDKSSQESQTNLEQAAKSGHRQARMVTSKRLVKIPQSLNDIQKAASYLSSVAKAPNIANNEALLYLGQIFVNWGIGNPKEILRKLRSQNTKKTNTTSVDIENLGIFAFYLFNYPVIEKDSEQAIYLMNTLPQESLWKDAVTLNEQIQQIAQTNNLQEAVYWLNKKKAKYNTIQKHDENAPHIGLLLRLCFRWALKSDNHLESAPVFLTAFAQAFSEWIDESSDNQNIFRIFCIDFVKLFIKFPEIHAHVKNAFPESQLKELSFYFDLASTIDDTTAGLFKAQNLWKGTTGFATNNRKEDLQEALTIYKKHDKKLNTQEIISMKLIENELNRNENDEQVPIDINMDDIEFDDENEDSPEESENQKNDFYPLASKSSLSTNSSSATSTQQKTNQDDDNDIDEQALIEEEKRKSKSKKLAREVLSYHMILPANYTPAEEKQNKKIYKVSKKAFEFYSMIFGQGTTTRIHHYYATDAAAYFKELCLKSTSKDMTQWEHTEKSGITHKLSFHDAHGRKENTLYPAVRIRIKRFLENISIELENIEQK